ncbi:hypothetical protein [Roseomonas sp. KE2513]|uniref:hypothetical protein n=1 Tax=Roseomonas sp. KE2513 TaxID=2479202 RepID=UPI0018DF781E|nr:hypothetical protein [Roseomonas sp. KE2513]
MQLYDDLLEHDVGNPERDLLAPAAERLSAFAPAFAHYRSLGTAPPPGPAEDLWT